MGGRGVPQERQCQGTNADGSPCGSPASFVDPESGFCPSHDPDNREKIREAARKGGQAMARRMEKKGLGDDELPPLDSPQAAERWLEATGRAVATGRLAHNEGKAVARLIREWLRAREAGEVAARMEELEEKMAALKRGDLKRLK